MKRLIKKSLYKIFVSLFVIFYTFVPQSIAIGQVIDEYSQGSAVPIIEEEIPEESLLEEEVVLPEEEISPVVEEPVIEEPVVEEPVVQEPVVKPEEVIKEVMSYPVWVINGTTATTYDVVQLGKTYIAPQNSRVRIIFTKLPENPTKLTIEEITLTQEEIDATGAVSNRAYDIKTDMIDGTFEYDLVLPSLDEDTKVVYAEEREDIFIDLKEVTNTIVNEGDTIKIEDLEHFTIYIVSTYSDALLTLEEDEFYLGDTVYAKGTSNNNKTLRIRFRDSNNNIVKTCDLLVEGKEISCSYDLSISDPVGIWSIELLRLSGSWETKDNATFEVKRMPTNVCNNDDDDYSLSSSGGIWTSVNSSYHSNVVGEGTNEVRWGDSTGYGKSGLRFDSVSTQTFDENTTFLLGTLTHMNWPIYNAANGATLRITLSFSDPAILPNPSFDYYFAIEETPNSGSCAYGGNCNDKITFPTSYGSEVITINDIQYTLVIDGFVNSYTCESVGSVLNYFITEEQKNNSAYLVGHLSSQLIPAPAISIVKKTNNIDVASKENAPELNEGDEVTWQYIVQNTGNVDLSNISVVDNIIGTINCPASSLPASSNPSERVMTCTATGTVIAGQYENTATVKGTPPNNIEVSAEDTSWYFGVLKKGHIIVDKVTIPSGDSQEFSFTTTGLDYRSFSLTDTSNPNSQTLFPGEYSVEEDIVPGWEQTAVQCVSSTGDPESVQSLKLDPEEIITCTFTNTKYFPIIEVEKSSSTTEITDSGQVIPYTFVVSNGGNQILTGITVSDPICNSSPIYISGDLNSDNKLDLEEEWTYTCDHTVTQEEIDNLGGGDEDGKLDNTVTVDSNESDQATDSYDIPVIQTPSLDVTKVADVESVDGAGDVITYTIEVINTGNTTLTGVSVSDPLLSNLDCSSAEGYQTTGLTIAVGSKLTCTGTYTVLQADIDNNGGGDGDIDNTVTADSTQTESDTASEMVGIIQNPLLNVVKSSTTSVINTVGQVVPYRFTISNTGNMTLTSIKVTDSKCSTDPGYLSGDTNSDDKMQLDEIWIYTCNHTVTEGEIDLVSGNGYLRNTVTVDSEESQEDTDNMDIPIRAGKIYITKQTNPGDSLQSFEFKPSWRSNFFLSDNQTLNSGWLALDSYSIQELTTTTPGWELTSTSCISSIRDTETIDSLELDAGETITCTFTNTRDTGSLTIYKVIDEDGDLTTTDDQIIGVNWEFDVDGTGPDTDNPSSALTDFLDGKVTYTNLKTGAYTIREYPLPGYEIVGATCGVENGSLDGYAMESVNVSKNASTICMFYNTPNSSIHGYKFNDLNQDGFFSDEPLLSGWTINLYKWNGETFDTEPLKSMDTDSGEIHFGWYWFDHLFPGMYKVCEVEKEGWNQSSPINGYDNCHIIELPEMLSDKEQSANYVVGPEYNFGNYVIPAELEITKQNDSPISGLETGSTVLYTLRIEAPSDESEGTYLVNNVKVTDLLPEGFGYVLGSWTAVLENTEGIKDLKALGITTEPTYNGIPGEWNLGDLKEGDIVTLTYVAKINLLNEPGTYKDLAYVLGDKILSPKDTGDVLGVSYNPGYANTDKLGVNFIGTKVLVVEPIEDGGEVLGASITLPVTGADTYITLGALISMILGFVLILFGKKRKIGTLFVALVISLGLFTLLKPIETYAETQTQVSIRLEQPKTGITDRVFEIAYVALSIPSKPITVQCEKSLDGTTFTDFDSPKTTNSGTCKVDESIVTGSGTYYFRATATADGVSNTSEIVSVNIIGNPLPVTEYSKSKGTCTYTLKFKSTTSKVQIYRSDNQKSFYADDTTLITNPPLSVTPNVLTTYTDSSITDCGKEYFYAIRSVDDYNNVSSLVTDDIVTIVRTPAPITPTEITGEEEGEVAGEETTPEEEKEDESGEVKGDEDVESEDEKEEEKEEDSDTLESFWSDYKYFIIAVLVVALGSGAYKYVRRKK